MKRCLTALFLTLSLSNLALSDNIPTRSKEADPEYKNAVDQLNADTKAWNARCVVTNSDAEQKWCEKARGTLEARKVSLRNGVIPNSPGAKPAVYPTINVILRYNTRGKILKQVQ